ncbi:hypothetical protein BDV37DRAFT_264053 [Aspergillus pseudonomiae]|uniref:Uncharacterized protein n=1 Tax=Aspergillus pseudonomiae TaxID=1506151 RepID=A0A5N7CX41_9EURO|nr:uncharacterized protein BDV37DRAFT_264053 [Aspergillus pseudonomiae]KAE8398163.1 hypothetical protein BDV37DRAFT_264053 [Aspergillus pseudonomiae]
MRGVKEEGFHRVRISVPLCWSASASCFWVWGGFQGMTVNGEPGFGLFHYHSR